MIRMILECIRIMAIVLVFGAIMSGAAHWVFSSFGVQVNDSIAGLLISISVLILLFVWYRNKLQFSGFVKKGQKKLSKKVSTSLITLSIFMLVTAPMVG
ncbi:hypothetical protein ABEV54_21565 [Peribacillus psychrosaccharolyticus]|uniref:hypothetical protein n=1 Tax=Peribacillus psychrosaccharolyticus TaxID=1407 RepID=UPI003D2AE97C